MGEVPGPDDRDALAPRPPGEPGNVTVLTARPGEARVDMQVGVKHPASLAAFSLVVRGSRGVPPALRGAGRRPPEPAGLPDGPAPGAGPAAPPAPRPRPRL